MDGHWLNHLDYVYRSYAPVLKKYGIETKSELEKELVRLADAQNVDLDKTIRTKDKLVTAVMVLIINRKNDPGAVPEVPATGPDVVAKKAEPAKKAPKE